MNKLLLFFSLSLSFTSFSQEIFVYKSGGKILQNGVVVPPNKVREILSTNQHALEIYNAGRVKKTFGNILLTGGLVLLPSYYLYYAANNGTNKVSGNNPSTATIIGKNEVSTVPLYLAGAMIIIAIPIKLGFSNKIRDVVKLMNEDVNKQKTTFIESADFIANSNGIGVSIGF